MLNVPLQTKPFLMRRSPVQLQPPQREVIRSSAFLVGEKQINWFLSF